MTAPSRRRSTRDRPAKQPLSRDAVVDAALAILQSEGLPAVTMRRVAEALDTGPASLYVYVSGREGLLAAMEERITAGVELESPDASRWRPQLHALLDRMRQALLAYPGMAAVSISEPPATESSWRVLENLMGILLAAGLSGQDAAWGADICSLLVTYAAIEADARDVDSAELASGFYANFTALPPERYPVITAHAAELIAGDSDVRFRFAVDVVIDGLLARSAPARAGRRTRGRG